MSISTLIIIVMIPILAFGAYVAFNQDKIVKRDGDKSK